MRNAMKSLRAGEMKLFYVFTVVLIIGLVLISVQYMGLSNRYRVLSDEYELLSNELEVIISELESLKELEDLLIKNPYTRFSSGFDIVSGYSLEYEETWGANFNHTFSTEGFSAVFYAPLDNLTLRMHPFIYFPMDDFAIPLTLQRGNAYLNESAVLVRKSPVDTIWQSPIIWSRNATGKGVYDTQLPSKGWYTLSMVGPIRRASGGGLRWRFIGARWIKGTLVKEDRVHAWVDFRLMRGEELVLFAVSRRHR